MNCQRLYTISYNELSKALYNDFSMIANIARKLIVDEDDCHVAGQADRQAKYTQTQTGPD